MNVKEDKILSFSEFIISYVSLSVIAGLFTYRVLNSFFDNILFPIVDLTILPDKKFLQLSLIYDSNRNELENPSFNNSDYHVSIRFGLFIKELIIWMIIMTLLYMLYNISIKLN